MKMLFLILFSFAAEAQEDFEFQMAGTYPLNTGFTMGPTTISFKMDWNENDGVIEGTYQDNFLTSGTPITGTYNDDGRVFQARVPQYAQNVSTITIETTETGFTQGSTPITITVRNPRGIPMGTSNIRANVTSNDLDTEDITCEVGFGALTGYCGQYEGDVTESADAANRCHLNTFQNLKLDLSNEAKVSLYMTAANNILSGPVHELGDLPPSPLSTTLTITGRNCGSLPATTFNPAQCQSLNLTGTFSETAGVNRFVGTYTMTDEVSGERCSYFMNLTRQLAY